MSNIAEQHVNDTDN